jgi:hypothetical protein
MAWDVLANYCIMSPHYFLMQQAYEDYKQNTSPAGLTPKNQCAVRMSLALGRCGFSLDAFPDQRRVISKQHLPVPYVQGAKELADYLQTMWGAPQVFRRNLNTVAQTLNNQKGIVYFNNCFHRADDPEGTRQGDHIDLWNGTHYYNQVYHLRAGMEDRLSSGPLFTSSDSVWFFRLY